MHFSKDILLIDCEKEESRICDFIREQIKNMRREGAVIGISGGIDSALAACLCVKALGADKVQGLILPEKESNPISQEYAWKLAKNLGINTEEIDLTPALEKMGTYARRDEIVREIFPDYDSSFRMKITLPPDILARDAFNFFTLTLQSHDGQTFTQRLSKKALNGIVSATNTKQRTRMIYLYLYAEKLNYLVCGTTNRSETRQGFFVKFGDGGVDIEPLAHLYKTQVYQLSEHMGVIPEIIARAPSPDTYSIPVSDEEFFFRMPLTKVDLLLYAWENQVPVPDICRTMELTDTQVKRVFRDFESKEKASSHAREMPATLTD